MPSSRSLPYPLGVSYQDGLAQVAVLAAHAELVEFCLLDPSPSGGWVERRVPLTNRTHDIWHDVVHDVVPGQRYGFRVHGPWDPARGLRHNPAKLLTDPYARAVAFADPKNPTGTAPRLRLAPELFGHTVDADLVGDPDFADQRDSIDHAVHAVLMTDTATIARPRPPHVPWSHTVIYEAHVRGFTAALPGVPPELRGTYAGLGTSAAIEHLVSLGITTIELLPIFAIGDEPHLVRGGRVNYWGYNTAAFFAPHPGYAATKDPAAVPDEVRAMVDSLHQAGLEVVLDVVYNHTCEAGVDGPTLSFKGLDCASYYRLTPQGDFTDTTGCGNSLDFSSPRVIQMTLDSLRYWVSEIGVDGFRFDLATTLARGASGGFQSDHPFLVALQTDPVLAGTKLIVEPWDIGDGGWRTGQYPAPLSEWNDHYRNDVREFWLVGMARLNADEEPGGVRNLATRVAGSADVFSPRRGPLASINFVTAHDGFTLHDLVSYNVKHNEKNGENNRDGSDGNLSYNHGVEGPTADLEILNARHRAIRNLLATLMLSTGVPMLVAGDELGRTQGGNNNAYSTDDASTWLDWDLAPWQQDLLATTTYLIGLRRDNPALGQANFFAGRPQHGDGSEDLAWFNENGDALDHNSWFDPWQRVLQIFFHAVHQDAERGFIDSSFLIVIQATNGPRSVRLAETEPTASYHLIWDSTWSTPPNPVGDPRSVHRSPGDVVTIDAATLQIYRVPPHAM